MTHDEDNLEKTVVTDGRSFLSNTSEQCALVHIYPQGPNMGKKWDLKDNTFAIGRDPTSDIVINSDSASRRHAALSKLKAGWILEDKGSTNGTYVNDQLIAPSHVLKPGDQIKIGDTIFKYLSGSDVETSYHEEIYRMTIIDGLTGIYNKRFFIDEIKRENARSQRYQRPLSLIMIDIDHFKQVNDNYGHLAGDHVLRSLCQVISSRSRREEVFSRYGGEEFAILIPETDLAGARQLAEQIRELVARNRFEFEGSVIPVTISIGIASTSGQQISDTDFIAAADEKLYRAKHDGRNCVRG